MNPTNSPTEQSAPKVGDKWFRYDGYADQYGNSIRLEEWTVLSVTRKGVWLRAFWDWGGRFKKFVLIDATKKHAHPTKGAALTSFVRRKVLQVDILRAQLERADYTLVVAREMQARAENTAV